MRNNVPATNDDAQPRPSMESSRRPSFGFNRKNSDVASENKRNSRRFSFLPANFSINNFSKKDQSYDQRDGRPESKGAAFGRGSSRSPSMSTTNSTIPLYYEADREAARQQRRPNAPPSRDSQNRYDKALPPQPGAHATPPPIQRKQYRDDGYGGNLLEPTVSPQQASGLQPQEPVERFYTPTEDAEASSSSAQYNNSAAYGRGYAPTSSTSAGYRDQNGFEGGAYARTEALPEQAEKQQIRPSGRKFEYDQGGHERQQ